MDTKLLPKYIYLYIFFLGIEIDFFFLKSNTEKSRLEEISADG